MVFSHEWTGKQKWNKTKNVTCQLSTFSVPLPATHVNLYNGLTVFGTLRRLPRLLPFALIVGVPLRLRDIVSVLLALVRLVASSCKQLIETKKKPHVVTELYWLFLFVVVVVGQRSISTEQSAPNRCFLNSIANNHTLTTIDTHIIVAGVISQIRIDGILIVRPDFGHGSMDMYFLFLYLNIANYKSNSMYDVGETSLRNFCANASQTVDETKYIHNPNRRLGRRTTAQINVTVVYCQHVCSTLVLLQFCVRRERKNGAQIFGHSKWFDGIELVLVHICVCVGVGVFVCFNCYFC